MEGQGIAIVIAFETRMGLFHAPGRQKKGPLGKFPEGLKILWDLEICVGGGERLRCWEDCQGGYDINTHNDKLSVRLQQSRAAQVRRLI